jgi:hypothetical protein
MSSGTLNGQDLERFRGDFENLRKEIAKVIESRESYVGFSKSQFGSQKAKFNCGGCDGVLYFEFKKERDFATLQMKLLNESEERRRSTRCFWRIAKP